MSPLVWLTPTLLALLLYGMGQGFVKKWISEVPPARFCLYFVAAKALVNLGYFFTRRIPLRLLRTGTQFCMAGIVRIFSMEPAGFFIPIDRGGADHNCGHALSRLSGIDRPFCPNLFT